MIETNTYTKKIKLTSTKELTADSMNKSSILNGAKYFSTDKLENYLVIDLIRRHIVPTDFTIVTDTADNNNNVTLWKSTRLSQEKIINP